MYSEFIPLEPTKLNLDELYDDQINKRHYISDTYNIILKRIHAKIKNISRCREYNMLCWYVVPDLVFGRQKYDIGECISFLMNALIADGCKVRYIGPNLLCISWVHYVPKYARKKLKQQGVRVSDKGEIERRDELSYSDIPQLEPPRPARESDMRALSPNSNINDVSNSSRSKPVYKSTTEYKPTGKLLYTPDMVSKLHDANL